MTVIVSEITSEIGYYPEIETVYNAETPHFVTVNRFGGLVVDGPGRYERLAQSAVYDLGLRVAEYDA